MGSSSRFRGGLFIAVLLNSFTLYCSHFTRHLTNSRMITCMWLWVGAVDESNFFILLLLFEYWKINVLVYINMVESRDPSCPDILKIIINGFAEFYCEYDMPQTEWTKFLTNHAHAISERNFGKGFSGFIRVVWFFSAVNFAVEGLFDYISQVTNAHLFDSLIFTGIRRKEIKWGGG